MVAGAALSFTPTLVRQHRAIQVISGPRNPLASRKAGTPSPRRHYRRWLIATGAVALAAGATVGGLIGTMGSTTAGTVAATSKTALSASQIAARADPGLVDVLSTDGDEDATSAGTGIVLSSTGEVLTNNHVIEGATSTKVTDIGNGQTYTATIVGYDATQDVAVLQLQGASGLTAGDTITSLGGQSISTAESGLSRTRAARRGPIHPDKCSSSGRRPSSSASRARSSGRW